LVSNPFNLRADYGPATYDVRRVGAESDHFHVVDYGDKDVGVGGRDHRHFDDIEADSVWIEVTLVSAA